ncbi:MAG: 4-hydroxythreonine-4-phosphate dehydrogenase PdxA, partial [Deltaproteobacteria bacterium]|nr:4-hydroxythreonine-4-phosphate dehydrogenase PdxA [Deltaproteobacteria bacterium]
MTTLAVTLGDPAGIGPEVTAAALAAWRRQASAARVVLCGPANLVEPMAARLDGEASAQ